MSALPAISNPALILEQLRRLEDVPLTVTAELDRRVISVRELLGLKVNSLLLLNRPTGENIDVYLGEVLLASSEILVVDGTLAVRIADLRDKAMSARTHHLPLEQSHGAEE